MSMNDPEHFVHATREDGTTKVLNFKGSAVPREGDRIKLQSANQGVDGEFKVTNVRWSVTNAGSTRNRFVSEAQAEVWAEPWVGPKKRPLWLRILVAISVMAAYAAAIGAAYFFGSMWGLP